jgi:tRNA-binding EMAP/Myf-like protein
VAFTNRVARVVIVTAGAVVGCVLEVSDHPDAQAIWLATVDIGGRKLEIVFGGQRKIAAGELVPVAPPGATVQVRPADRYRPARFKKMRVRRYRGQRSHGMLCSLDELGWCVGGPDEVPVLRRLEPGYSLHSLKSNKDRSDHVERPDALLLADVNDAARDETSQTVTK